MIDPQHDVLDTVDETLPYLREHAAEAEEQRRLPDETAKRLRDSGLMRLLQPTRYGGYEADPRVFYESVMRVGTACGSTAWVAGVVGIHAYELGMMDDRVQAEIWGDDPDVWISSSYVPNGRAVPVDGGYRLTGRWSFSSGSDHCRWVYVGGMVTDEDGNVPADFDVTRWLHMLLPRQDYQIDDVWNVVGLAGTGSNDIVVEDMFVPDYRTINFADLRALRCPGHEVNHGPVYRLPWHAMFINAICAPAVGIARGALDEFVGYQKRRTPAIVAQAGAMFDPPLLQVVGQTSAEIDTARLQLLDDVADMYRLAEADEDIPTELKLRIRRNQVVNTTRAVSAVEALYLEAGGRALARTNPLQRMWRDVHAARAHMVNGPALPLRSYGSVLLGGPPLEPFS